MMEESGSRSNDVFALSPSKQQSLVDRFIEITLKNRCVLSGILYTIDTVSGSCILITNENNSISVKIVLQDFIEKIVFCDTPSDLQEININNLFTFDISQKSSKVNKAEKERVKTWLMKNMLSVEEEGDILKLDTLEIHPPYDASNCYSSNSIVLDRVQTLLKKMEELDG